MITCKELLTMTISERIFDLLEKRGMSQKEFSEKTGIAQSTISDWKRKKTNPVSEKILIICEVLDVTPYELLGAAEGKGKRSNPSPVIIIERDSDYGHMMEDYISMDSRFQERMLGYMAALMETGKKDRSKRKATT